VGPPGRLSTDEQAARELTLEDINLPNRRITIAGHRQPLGTEGFSTPW
jgi:hypothetical protein